MTREEAKLKIIFKKIDLITSDVDYLRDHTVQTQETVEHANTLMSLQKTLLNQADKLVVEFPKSEHKETVSGPMTC